MTSVAPLLSVRGLSVTFGGVHALRDVSLEVQPGHVVALIGPNGAGKTTLLNALTGLVDCTYDEMSCRGRSLDRVGWRRPRMGIHRSFQHPQLVETETVLENLLAGAYVERPYSVLDQILLTRRYRAAEARHRERAHQLLTNVGLEHILQLPVAELPYGHRKLIDILRALIVPPHVLLLDEPSSGLDPTERSMVAAVLQNRAVVGDASILLVEHHMDLVRKVADQVVALQAGQVFMAGPTAQVLDSDALRASFTG